MKYKVLLGNGCSFTHTDGFSWVSQLQNKGGILKHHNIANGGSGNKFIVHSAISYIENLKKSYDTSEILFVNQWTGTARQDMFVEECIVNFKNGKAEYTGYVWCRESGEKVQLGKTYDVTEALAWLG